MITKEEYDKVQFLLGNTSRPRSKTHTFAFTGLMKCAYCGAYITAEEKFKHQQNGNVHHYIYYRCTKKIDANCVQKPIREEVLIAEVMDLLKRIEIPKLFHEWAIDTLKEMHEQEKSSRNSVISTKRHEYDSLVLKLDRLLEMRMANEITPDDYQVKKTALEKEKMTLSLFLADIDERISGWLKEVETSLDFAEKARKEFENGTPEKRKSILATLGYNHTLKDGKLNVATTKPLFIIEKAAILAKSISDRLEPPKSVAEQQHIKEKYTKSTQMWTP